MFNFEKLLTDFHDNHITLSRSQQKDMRSKRDNNLDRLERGLKDNDKPSVCETINQGGYAMKTMTQPPEGDEDSRYDIDLGVVFVGTETKGPRTTKQWVSDAIALKASGMKNEPEVKPKCVRVTYADGYQVDFPVFKVVDDGSVSKRYLATNDSWVESDPSRFNTWFETEVSEKSPQSEGTNQLRLIVRLVKYFCKVHSHREKLKYPAGLVSTAIAVECYYPSTEGLHVSFQQTLQRIGNRIAELQVLADGLVVSDEKDIQRIKRLVASAKDAAEKLNPLVYAAEEHDEADAKKMLKKVFRHSFFAQEGEKKAPETKSLFGAVAGAGVASPAIADQKIEEAKNEILNSGGYKKPWTSSRP